MQKTFCMQSGLIVPPASWQSAKDGRISSTLASQNDSPPVSGFDNGLTVVPFQKDVTLLRVLNQSTRMLTTCIVWDG